MVFVAVSPAVFIVRNLHLHVNVPFAVTVKSHGHHGVSIHRPLHCLFNRVAKHTSKKKKLQVTGLCEGNPPVIGGFPWKRATKAESVFVLWRHYAIHMLLSGHVFPITKASNSNSSSSSSSNSFIYSLLLTEQAIEQSICRNDKTS